MYHYDDITLHYLLAVKLNCKKEKKEEEDEWNEWQQNVCMDEGSDPRCVIGWEFAVVEVKLLMTFEWNW